MKINCEFKYKQNNSLFTCDNTIRSRIKRIRLLHDSICTAGTSLHFESQKLKTCSRAPHIRILLWKKEYEIFKCAVPQECKLFSIDASTFYCPFQTTEGLAHVVTNNFNKPVANIIVRIFIYLYFQLLFFTSELVCTFFSVFVSNQQFGKWFGVKRVKLRVIIKKNGVSQIG